MKTCDVDRSTSVSIAAMDISAILSGAALIKNSRKEFTGWILVTMVGIHQFYRRQIKTSGKSTTVFAFFTSNIH